MIHFMPFTYFSDTQVSIMVRSVGAMMVLQPLDALTPAAMRGLSAQGVLDLRPVPGVDAVRLERQLADYAAWAERQHGRGGDLAAYFRFDAAQAMRAVEESPLKIRSLIHQGGIVPWKADLLHTAALFLCLAHTYDMQQDALNRDLQSVQRLETRFGEIVGERSGSEGTSDTLPPPVFGQSVEDRGLYMTAQRVQAWARLALAADAVETLYLTDSPAVWGHMLDLLPKGVPVGEWPLSLQTAADVRGIGSGEGVLSELCGVLAHSPDPIKAKLPSVPMAADAASGPHLQLLCLAGCPPHVMLHLLAGQTRGDFPVQDTAAPRNVLIGLIET